MSKTDVLTLASDFVMDLADQDQLDTYYQDFVRVLGQDPVLTTMSALEVIAADQEYETPATAIALLAVYAGDRELPATTERELEAVDSDWRSGTPGTPRVHTTDDLKENSFQLYPTPDYSTGAVASTLADAMGASFVTGQLSLLYTEERDDIPQWLELIAALIILSREFLRESNHRDIPTAEGAELVSQVLKRMVI